ncbi:hypothetical protein ACIFOT_13135 [Neobacillus sp. NRS-1170]|uniref:hypothetical protein n=1 Tax=Neobacillus sp. NRS-1170 TaxID=3233898 RepID=UPI003D26F165
MQQLLEDEVLRVQRVEELRQEGQHRLADELDKYTTVIETEVKTNAKGKYPARIKWSVTVKRHWPGRQV